MGVAWGGETCPRRTRWMSVPRVRIRTLLAVVALVAGLLATWRAVSYRLAYSRKVEYYLGWARSHSLTAEFYRKQASDPNCSAEDAAGFRWLARKEELVSRKYAEIAAHPWLPYPAANAPLLTRQDWDQLDDPRGQPPAQAGR